MIVEHHIFGPQTRIVLYLAVAVFVLIGDAGAQSVRFGIEAGPSYVSFNFEDDLASKDASGRFSAAGMIFAEIRAGGVVLQPALRLARLGFKRPQDEQASPHRSTFTLGTYYLSMPLRVQVQLNRKGFYVAGGPEIGYLLSARGTTAADARHADPRKESFTSSMRRVNVALGGGIGMPITMGQRSFSVQLFYAHGLFDVGGDAARSTVRTSDLSFGIGYRF